jgi:hypothetical protein
MIIDKVERINFISIVTPVCRRQRRVGGKDKILPARQYAKIII